MVQPSPDRRALLRTAAWGGPTLAAAVATPAQAASVAGSLLCGRDYELTLDWNQMARLRNLTAREVSLEVEGVWDLAPLSIGFTGDRVGVGLAFASEHDGTVTYQIDEGKSHFRFRKTGALTGVISATLAPSSSMMMWSDTMESDGCTPSSTIVLTVGSCSVTYSHWCASAPF